MKGARKRTPFNIYDSALLIPHDARSHRAEHSSLNAPRFYSPAAARSAAARSVRSHEKSGSVRPK